MKNYIFLILFLAGITPVFACKCVSKSLAQSYLDADVVALVTVEDTYGDRDSNVQQGGTLYTADIKFEKIYKGTTFKILNVLGASNFINSGSCGILIKKGEKYLILLSKNRDGEFYASSCSTMPQISDDNVIKKYESIFNVIEKNKSKIYSGKFAEYEDLSNEYDIHKKQAINDFTKLDKKLRGKFGIYKVKIRGEGEIYAIQAVLEIGIKEKKIQELMKKNFRVYEGVSTQGEYFILLEL